MLARLWSRVVSSGTLWGWRGVGLVLWWWVRDFIKGDQN